jgi:hypothetical protein
LKVLESGTLYLTSAIDLRIERTDVAPFGRGEDLDGLQRGSIKVHGHRIWTIDLEEVDLYCGGGVMEIDAINIVLGACHV